MPLVYLLLVAWVSIAHAEPFRSIPTDADQALVRPYRRALEERKKSLIKELSQPKYAETWQELLELVPRRDQLQTDIAALEALVAKLEPAEGGVARLREREASNEKKIESLQGKIARKIKANAKLAAKLPAEMPADVSDDLKEISEKLAAGQEKLAELETALKAALGNKGRFSTLADFKEKNSELKKVSKRVATLEKKTTLAQMKPEDREILAKIKTEQASVDEELEKFRKGILAELNGYPIRSRSEHRQSLGIDRAELESLAKEMAKLQADQKAAPSSETLQQIADTQKKIDTAYRRMILDPYRVEPSNLDWAKALGVNLGRVAIGAGTAMYGLSVVPVDNPVLNYFFGTPEPGDSLMMRRLGLNLLGIGVGVVSNRFQRFMETGDWKDLNPLKDSQTVRDLEQVQARGELFSQRSATAERDRAVAEAEATSQADFSKLYGEACQARFRKAAATQPPPAP